LPKKEAKTLDVPMWLSVIGVFGKGKFIDFTQDLLTKIAAS